MKIVLYNWQMMQTKKRQGESKMNISNIVSLTKFKENTARNFPLFICEISNEVKGKEETEEITKTSPLLFL